MARLSVKEIVAWAQELLAEVRTTRNVHFIHVRGHSSDDGNDRADALVQWGKKEGRGYSRLREGTSETDAIFNINIIREGPIESDGTSGRLAMEEQAREKEEKERQRKAAKRNSTTVRRSKQQQPSGDAAVHSHHAPNGPGLRSDPGCNANHRRRRSSSNTSSSSRRGTQSPSRRRRDQRRQSRR